jgi:hypothetical protein
LGVRKIAGFYSHGSPLSEQPHHPHLRKLFARKENFRSREPVASRAPSHHARSNLRLTPTSRCLARGPFAILQWSPVSQASPISLQWCLGRWGSGQSSPGRGGRTRGHKERVELFHQVIDEPPRRCEVVLGGSVTKPRKTWHAISRDRAL